MTDLISRSGLQERVLHQTPIEGQAASDVACVQLQECDLLHPRNDYVPSCRLIQGDGLQPSGAAPVSCELG